jgi:hypothetical protein
MEHEDAYIQLVSSKLKIPVELISSKCRLRELCEARQVCSFILLEHTKLSLKAIAEKLHYKSHASPWRDRTQVAMFLEIDRKFAAKYLPVINTARKMAAEYIRQEETRNALIQPEPGDICWFWNFWSRFPVIGTYDKSVIDDNGEQRFVCREYPILTFWHCSYAGQEILPEKFQKPVSEPLIEDSKAVQSQSIPA